ncbi:helix-turn-helix domain-containing protein [Pseudoxanthomonas sp. USHLN014]|uniref:helix-turn-helix domain-containing protein n=1 Tax=Pseudoxanthomonas sp. USHLN014 TaxID=3081297 RepID=UPI00301C7385
MSRQQNQALLAALKAGPMTADQALRQLGIARASARVFDLRAQGYDIRSRLITVKNRQGDICHVAEYSLVTPQTRLIPDHPGRGHVTAGGVAA